jgi:hypothetical protein
MVTIRLPLMMIGKTQLDAGEIPGHIAYFPKQLDCDERECGPQR